MASSNRLLAYVTLGGLRKGQRRVGLVISLNLCLMPTRQMGPSTLALTHGECDTSIGLDMMSRNVLRCR